MASGAASTGLAVGGFVLGVGEGGIVLWIGLETGSSEVAMAGLLAGAYIITKSYKWATQLHEEASTNLTEFTEKSLNTSTQYRYVRFLPSKISWGHSETSFKKPFVTHNLWDKQRAFLELQSADQKTQIHFFDAP